jgi:fumarate reductase subunit C
VKGKQYVRPMPANWWLQKQPYTAFMFREFTALFVGGYAIFLIVMVYRALQGPEPFTAFVQGLKSPVSMILHLLVLLMTAYHSATWFNSMAKGVVLWRGEERVSDGTIIAGGYLLWLLASIVVAGIALSVARG